MKTKTHGGVGGRPCDDKAEIGVCSYRPEDERLASGPEKWGGRKDYPTGFRGTLALLTPWFQKFKPPHFWSFTTALGNEDHSYAVCVTLHHIPGVRFQMSYYLRCCV